MSSLQVDVAFETTDMDLGTANDAYSIFDAGRSETLAWLLDHGLAVEHAQLAEWLTFEDPTTEVWAAGEYEWFYGPDGVLNRGQHIAQALSP